jgi:hypothetical protein
MLATYRRHQPQAITHAITGVAVPNTPYRLLTRCFVSGGRRTSALVRTVKGGAYRLRRGYASSTNSSAHGPAGGPNPKDPHSSTNAPVNTTLFRASWCHFMACAMRSDAQTEKQTLDFQVECLMPGSQHRPSGIPSQWPLERCCS